jgi:two-component system, OmpR family, KDP operon response regulator KdpE
MSADPCTAGTDGPTPLTRSHNAATQTTTAERQYEAPVGKVDALDAGADDYVTKPFNVEELLARIRAVTRRLSTQDTPPTVRIGCHTIDIADRRIAAPDGGAPVHLTPLEWQILEVLVRNPGKLVSQRQLLQQVWGSAYRTETDYLRQYLKHLRRKLEDDPARPRHLLTEPGMGYRFQP